MKPLPLILISLLIFTCTKLNAQEIKKSLAAEFIGSKDIYLINSSFNNIQLKTGSGRVFTFEEIVKETWPEKNIINISDKDYNSLKDVKNKFHLSVPTLKISKDYSGGTVERGSITYVSVQKGKTGLSYTYLYWFQINAAEIVKGIAPERLIYAVENLKNLINNYNDASFRNKTLYRTVGYKDFLKNDTLYIKEADLSKKLKSDEKIKEVYSNPFKLVSQAQWEKAIAEKRPQVLFMDFVRGGNYSALKTFRASDGKLIIDSYPWYGDDKMIDRSMMKQLFNP